MKKIFSTLLVIGLLLAGSSVSAIGPGDGNSEGAKQRAANTEERDAKRQERQEQREERVARMTALFTEYNPDSEADFTAGVDTHETFHETQEALSDEWRQEQRAVYDALKAQLEAGEITQEEFDAQKAELKATMTEYRDEAKVLRDEKKEELSVVREAGKEIHAEITGMLDSGEVDSTRMAELLDSVIGLQADHLSVDQKYADLVNTLRSNY
jgi:predicted nucleic acid-binding protein